MALIQMTTVEEAVEALVVRDLLLLLDIIFSQALYVEMTVPYR